MNRIDRISAILIHLQTKKIVKASEISNRFNISLRTVYRDMKAIEEAGVPIGSEAGKGYYIVDGYHLPPIMFSKEEATSMLIGEKIINNVADEETIRNYGSAMYKIKAALPENDKEFLENLSPRIEILHYKTKKDEGDIQHQQSVVQQAIVQQMMLKIDYESQSKKELVEGRYVEPIGLCYYGFTWHLIGFCKLRKDYRDFRLDRIKKVGLTDVPFDPQKRNTIKEYLRTVASKRNLLQIVIHCKNDFLKYIEGTMQYYGYVGREKISDKETALVFMNDSLEYVGHWLLTCTNNIKIVEPAELKELVIQLAKKLHNHYIDD
jgi:predicted DNA-binding transcriptional regulator YafY